MWEGGGQRPQMWEGEGRDLKCGRERAETTNVGGDHNLHVTPTCGCHLDTDEVLLDLSQLQSCKSCATHM